MARACKVVPPCKVAEPPVKLHAMYRTRRHGSQKFNEKMARWRDIQLRKKLEEPAPYYGPEPPEIRRRIIVEDYDGPETTRHEIVLHRSNRIDCYRVEVDGRMLPGCIGAFW